MRSRPHNEDVPDKALNHAVVSAMPTDHVRPLDMLAGLSLALRTVLTLQYLGVTRITLLVEEGDIVTVERILGDSRVRSSIDAVAAVSPLDALRKCIRDFNEPVLVTTIAVIAEPSIYRQLINVDVDRSVVIAAYQKHQRLRPFVANTPLFRAVLAKTECVVEVDEVVEEVARQGQLGKVDVGSRWLFVMDAADERQKAIDALFEACRKPVDGLVSKYVNRWISIFLSKRLVDTSVTPNEISIITLLVAAMGTWAVAQGNYGMMLLGAGLLQANSILDGVDGELARVRFQQSRAGEWLDTMGDDLATLLFYGGLIVGVRDGSHGREFMLCGIISIGAMGLTILQYYIELIRLGTGDLYAIQWSSVRGAGIRGRVMRLFQMLLKRDFFILVYLLLAVVNLLPWALVVAVLGHVLVLLAATTRNIRRLLAT